MSNDPADHKPFTDDGVTYCGWRGDATVINGCGELWPCSTIRATTGLPSTEAVGEVRRREEEQIVAAFAVPGALIGKPEPKPCQFCGEIGKHATDCAQARSIRAAVEADMEVGRTSPECSTSAWTVHESCDNDMGCTCTCHRLEAAGWVPPIEAKALRALIRTVELYGTGYRWRTPSGGERLLNPADVDVFVSADQVTESERERRRLIGDDWTTNVELEQAVAEVKRARGVESMQAYELAKLLPEHLRKPFWEEAVKYYLADALALTEAVERDGCWVPLAEANQLRSDLAAMTSELAEERSLHQQTIAERDRWKSRASEEHVQALTLERDEARTEVESAWENLAIVEGNLKSVIEQVKGERDAAVRNWVGVQDGYERALPVVEAARTFVTAEATRHDPAIDSAAWLDTHEAALAALAAAVDVYTNREADRAG